MNAEFEEFFVVPHNRDEAMRKVGEKVRTHSRYCNQVQKTDLVGRVRKNKVILRYRYDKLPPPEERYGPYPGALPIVNGRYVELTAQPHGDTAAVVTLRYFNCVRLLKRLSWCLMFPVLSVLAWEIACTIYLAGVHAVLSVAAGCVLTVAMAGLTALVADDVDYGTRDIDVYAAVKDQVLWWLDACLPGSGGGTAR